MAHDVFICYANEDERHAKAACAALEAKGMHCWIAPRDVPPGVPYAEAIIDAIGESRVLVLVLSSSSNKSNQVPREVERAASRGIPILPFRIENVAPSKDVELFIGGPHWLNAYTPPLKQHLERLGEAVENLLGRDATPPPPPPPPPSPPPPPPLWPDLILRMLFIGGGVVALLAVVLVTYIIVRPSEADSFFKRGKDHYDRREYEEALEAFGQAVELDPRYAKAHRGRGLALARLAEGEEGENKRRLYKQAVAAYRRAIELEPNDAIAHFNRGWALEQLAGGEEGEIRRRLYEDALAAYERAIQLDRDYTAARTNKANLLMKLGR